MKKKTAGRKVNYSGIRGLARDYMALSYRILDYANSGLTRLDYLREVSKILLDFSGCDEIELWIKRRKKYFYCTARGGSGESFKFDVRIGRNEEEGGVVTGNKGDADLRWLAGEVMVGSLAPSLPFFTKGGSFCIGDTREPLSLLSKTEGEGPGRTLNIGGKYRTIVLKPLAVGEEILGLLQLKSGKKDFFSPDEIGFYEGIAQTLGVALTHRRLHVELRERVKELTCLYGIARLVEEPGISLEEIFQGIADILPPSWLYPEVASGRIILDGRSYKTKDFRESPYNLKADIIVSGRRRGFVEVVYSEEKPELDEGPFLREERTLIDTIAREIALILERKHAEEEKSKLKDQLRHADRLATIGELAAGVAHELNEPLGSILGFAQLARKCPGLPGQAELDIGKIESASLHAREVIKKLMLFARETAPHKTRVNLNRLVEEGLYFFESRCAKNGVELVRSLSPDIPEVVGDPAQLNQVLVTLVGNALQAMHEGGTLKVRTSAGEEYVSLVVEGSRVGAGG